MKKHIIILFLVVFIMISCRKTRSCYCSTITTNVTTIGGNSNTITTNSASIVTKDSQKKVEFRKSVSCYGYKTTTTSINGSIKETTTIDVNCEVR